MTNPDRGEKAGKRKATDKDKRRIFGSKESIETSTA